VKTCVAYHVRRRSYIRPDTTRVAGRPVEAGEMSAALHRLTRPLVFPIKSLILLVPARAAAKLGRTWEDGDAGMASRAVFSYRGGEW
jgi:hypothetical protein